MCITANLGYTGSVIMDFGYNKFRFHSLAIFLCLITVPALVILIYFILNLRLCRISPTFPNSWFSSAILFLAKEWTFLNGYSVFTHGGLTHQNDIKTAHVI